jgi:hypothetical protein
VGGACGTSGEKIKAYGIWLGNQKDRDHWQDLGVEVRIILREIFTKTA